MCGIAGMVGDNNPQVLGAMLSTLHHRGPDHLGTYLEAGLSIGMTRLSIIDLASGNQPIFSPDKNLCIVFNGEIYNFKSLKKEILDKDSRPFTTKSDTEVLLRAYELWGEDCLKRLRGMFAFAIWDKKKSELFLARDRMGKKPLYYGIMEDKLIFASELKALLASNYFSREPHLPNIDHYLTLRYPQLEESFIDGIHKLLPGQWLKFSHGQIRTQIYWSLPSYKLHVPKLSYHEAEEALWNKLVESVQIRLVSDVPLGVLLSGGLDSSAIVALMSEINTSSIETFSIGYPRSQKTKSYDERDKAKKIAGLFGTKHHEIELHPQDFDIFSQLIWHLDEPIADEAFIPTYLLCKEARRNVKVLLGGEGADEVLGGYPRYILHKWAELMQSVPYLKPILQVAKHLPISAHYRSAIEKLCIATRNPIDLNTNWVQIFSGEEKDFLYTTDFKKKLNGYDTASQHLNPQGSSHALDKVIFFDQKLWLVEDLLMKLDKMSMAASIETRSPFVDHEFVELMNSLPMKFKVNFFKTKKIFKKTLERALPKETIYQKKQAFQVPLNIWFKQNMRPYVEEQLLSEQAMKRGYFNPKAVKYFVDEHFAGRQNFHSKIFTLLCLEVWHQVFVD